MFPKLSAPKPGQKPGKPTKVQAKGIGTKKRKMTEEELKENDDFYEKHKRKRGFVATWPQEWPWLGYDEDKIEVYCKICRAYPSYADK